jgi:NAD(P)-dependent dehydrogenase (short-subunit alcohol dehydrogenase family)
MAGGFQFDFEGETVIVTGSTKGIGHGIARRLAETGANVVVNARTESDVERVAADLRPETPKSVLGVSADVAEPAGIDRLVDTTLDRFGGVDLLANNAAVWPGSHLDGSMHTDDLDDWDHGFDVNVRGPFYAITRVAAAMIETDRTGAIVNLSSGAGYRDGGGHGIYGVTKAAVNGLTWRSPTISDHMGSG